MGILNVTPDSFSDGGQWTDVDRAVEYGVEMARQGADVIDVGGESSRPGAARVSSAEQRQRILPVIERLHRRLGAEHPEVVISVDTTRADVAAPALEAGAAIVNDIAAGREDPELLDAVARSGAGVVLMHMQGSPATMQREPTYDDVVAEVLRFLAQRVEAARAAGVDGDRVLVDPGIGFGKTREHNLQLLANLPRLVAEGHPILLGTSRKRFMGSICTYNGRVPAPHELVDATCATTALGVAAGVALFRVHDVLANRRAADVAAAVIAG